MFTDSCLRSLKTNVYSSLVIYTRFSLKIAGKHISLSVNICCKVSIITIGTWYKALWSPNLTWNHNKKVFHLFFWNFSFQKLHTHLFSGNDRNRATKVNKNSKVVKIYFFKPKVIKMYFFNQKMVEHQNIPMSFNFSDPGAYITYLMLLYLPYLK